jgi:hypothetical protein
MQDDGVNRFWSAEAVASALKSAISSRRERTPQAPKTPKSPPNNKGLLAQVFKGAFGGKVALEVLVEAIGDVGGVGVLGACKVGDGFAWGGEEFGAGELLVGLFGFGSCSVEGCVVDELLDVVQ